jgi:hypothetical protein
VLFGVVVLSDIIDVKISRAILVQDVEASLSNSLSSGVHFTSDHSQELII